MNWRLPPLMKMLFSEDCQKWPSANYYQNDRGLNFLRTVFSQARADFRDKGINEICAYSTHKAISSCVAD
jgi:hypothetical protein